MFNVHGISYMSMSMSMKVILLYIHLKNSLINKENTKKNHKRVVYVIQIHVDIHKL